MEVVCMGAAFYVQLDIRETRFLMGSVNHTK
jgi:hypothetical protein